MDPTELTIEVLKTIRDELRGTNTRLDTANLRLDTVNVRLDRVERRQADTEVRLATEIAAVVGALHEVRDLLREDRHLRGRVDDHERRLTAVETRFG
jgi:chromosome segregation ATPase